MSLRGPVLQVFPDAARVERALVAAASTSTFVDASAFLTFSQLIDRCGGAAALGRRACSPLVARGVLARALRAVPSGPFGELATEPSFIRAALELIFELKAGRCTPAQLSQAVEAFARERRTRAEYVAAAYRQYENQMATLRLADREDALAGAVQVMARPGAWKERFGRWRGLELRHLHDFTPLRRELLINLAARCQEAGVVFQLELPGAGNAEVDGPVDEVHRAFEAQWQALEVDVLKALPPADRPLGRLAAMLFRRDASSAAALGSLVGTPRDGGPRARRERNPDSGDEAAGEGGSALSPPRDRGPGLELSVASEGGAGGARDPEAPAGMERVDGEQGRGDVEAIGSTEGPRSLCAFSAASGRDENRALAARARDLIDSGVPPEEIVIAFRDLAEEAEDVVAALETYGVPAHARRGKPLGATALGRLALGFPLLVDDRFPASRVARWLEGRYAPSLGPVSTPARWLQLASIRHDGVGAREGRGAYEVRLSALAERLERADQLGPAARVRETLVAVRRLLQVGAGLPERGGAAEMLAAWWRCLDSLGLWQAPFAHEPVPSANDGLAREVLQARATDQAAVEGLRQLVRELTDALAVAEAGREPMTRRALHRWLTDAARDVNLAPRGPRAGSVRVLDLRELSGLDPSHLLVGGMLDGRFPGKSAGSSLFPDEDRAKVNAALGRGVFRLSAGDLAGRLPWRLAEDRWLFQLALSASRGTTTFSYARRTAEGQEQPRSPFLDELERLVGLKAEALPLTPIRSSLELRSEAELRERAALEAFAIGSLRASPPEPAGLGLAKLVGAEGWFTATRRIAAIEEERLRFFSDPLRAPGPYTGKVDHPGFRDLLAQVFAFDERRPVSASALARFGNCGFQGFLSWVLRLEELDAPGEELDNRGRGTFWHLLLEGLFPALQEAGLLGRPPEEVPDALLDQVLEKASARAAMASHLGHPSLWRLSQGRARSMARRVLGAETRGLPFESLLPEAAEVSFGKRTSPGPWRQVVIPAIGPGETPIALAGSIDRVDALGTETGLVDYKSGRVKPTPQLSRALLTTEFQLPLYLFAARAAGRRGPLRAAWLQLKNGQVVPFEGVLAHAGESLEDLLAVDRDTRLEVAARGGKNLANAVHGLARRLREGEFAARPEDCELCSYRAVCRVTDRRIEEPIDG